MTYTEPFDKMSAKTLDIAKAMKSLREELEATDYYHQRAETVSDPELRKIFEHNRDEEKEHAAMLLEWIRRNMDGWDKELKDYIFTEGPIGVHPEDGEEKENKGSLEIGKL